MSLAAGCAVATSALAADHTDPTSPTTAGSDITDVYTWMATDTKVALIMDINADQLSDQLYYVFHIGRQDAALTAATVPSTNQNLTNVICWMDASDVTCVLDDGSGATADYAVGDASTDLDSANGMFRVHVAQHADPFFFYLQGFQHARAEVLQYAGALTLDANGCPDTTITHPEAGTGAYPAGASVAEVLQGILTGDFDDMGVDMPGGAIDNFAAGNVTGIVIELETSALAGTGDFLQVWGATHVRN
jgi:hypothetical protein